MQTSVKDSSKAISSEFKPKILAKHSEKDIQELSSSDSIPLFLNKLFNSDPLENPKPKFIISYDPNSNEVHIEKQLVKLEEVRKSEEPVHCFFSNSENSPFLNEKVYDRTELNLTSMDEVLVFSPHPDDDILGACALIHRLIKLNKKLKIVYMTSGKSAGSSDVRRDEAIRAVKVLGGDEENLVFTNLPFYDKSDRKISNEDTVFLLDLITKLNPQNIFICADIFDPHLTHRNCFNVIINVLKEKSMSNIQAYFYYSVWYVPKDAEYSHIIPYDFDIYKLKVNAMLEHKSQFETKFMGSDPRPFYQRAISRDSSYGKKFGFDFCEVYYKLNKFS